MWFVAKTKAKQERSVVRQIERLGIEAYIPLRTELRKWSDRKKRVEVVLIPNTVFVNASKQVALDLHNVHGISLSYLRDATMAQNGLMVIPDCQMDDFKRFVDLTKGEFEVEDARPLVKGDAVIVVQGPLKGIVGELVKVDKKNKVIVRLKDLIACSVTVDAGDLEKVNGLG